jgi:hypothetical protein
MELLRLAAWCKNLPPDISGMFSSRSDPDGEQPASQVFDRVSVEFLIQLGLINRTGDGRSIRLRDKGARLLGYLGYRYHRDTKYRSDPDDRRVEAARILLTFWRAGFDVYAGSLEDLGSPQVFLPSLAARQDKASNIWGGSVFRGLARFGQTACACYFTGEEKEPRLNHRNERFILDKAALRFSLREAMLFADPDPVRLARAFRNNGKPKPPEKEAEITLPRLLAKANHPVYLLPLGNAGALQLRMMREQDYMERLSAAFFRAQGAEGRLSPVPAGVTAADGMLGGVGPWIFAADLDIGRLDRALRQSLAAGYGKLFALCFESQKAALRQIYGEDRVTLLFVPEECVLNAFGELPLYTPKPGVYTNKRGGTVDASNLPVR